MKVLGFNFTKISAERNIGFEPGPISTNIEFLEIEKDRVEMLKESEALRTRFKFSITYKKSEEKDAKTLAELSFEGILLLSAEKEEAKEILKSWKKKEIAQQIRLPLFNLILRKCSVKALNLEEELNLPPHVPLPKLQAGQKK